MFGSIIVLASCQALVLLLIPILARSYSVESFSFFASFLFFYSVGSGVATLRLADAIVKEDPKFLSQLNSFLILLSILVSTIFAILHYLFISSEPIISFLLFITITLFSVSRLFYFNLIRTQSFISGSLVLGGLNVLTAMFQIGFSDYDFGLVYGLCGAITTLLLFQILFIKISFSAFNVQKIKMLLRRNQNYAIYLTAYSLVGILKLRAVFLFLGMHPLAGVLFQFEKLANAPNTFISAVIRPIIFRKFEEKDFVEKALPIVAGLSWVIFSLLVPFTVLLFQHHQLVVRTIFGAQWESYSLYFFIIWLGYSFFSAFNCYDRIYDILNKQKQKFQRR